MKEVLALVEISRQSADEIVQGLISETRLKSINEVEERLYEDIRVLHETKDLPLMEKPEKKASAAESKKEDGEEKKDRVQEIMKARRILTTKAEEIRSAIDRMENYRTMSPLTKQEQIAISVARVHLAIVEEYRQYLAEDIQKELQEDELETLRAIFSKEEVDDQSDLALALARVKKIDDFKNAVTNASYRRGNTMDKFSVQIIFDSNEGADEFIKALQEYFGAEAVETGPYKNSERIIVNEIPFSEASLLVNSLLATAVAS